MHSIKRAAEQSDQSSSSKDEPVGSQTDNKEVDLLMNSPIDPEKVTI